MAIQEAIPAMSIPEEASREDLIHYLLGITPIDPDEDGDNGLGIGVRNRGPKKPAGTMYAKAEPESEN